MEVKSIRIKWPNGNCTFAKANQAWLEEARKANLVIPVGCLTGSCGACEIEVNGEIIRACINQIPNPTSGKLKIDFAYDPFW